MFKPSQFIFSIILYTFEVWYFIVQILDWQTDSFILSWYCVYWKEKMLIIEIWVTEITKTQSPYNTLLSTLLYIILKLKHTIDKDKIISFSCLVKREKGDENCPRYNVNLTKGQTPHDALLCPASDLSFLLQRCDKNQKIHLRNRN